MAQSEKCLPLKNENPRIHVKPRTIACACNPNNAEAGTGSLELTDQEA